MNFEIPCRMFAIYVGIRCNCQCTDDKEKEIKLQGLWARISESLQNYKLEPSGR